MKLSALKSPNIKEFEFINPYTEEPTGIFIAVHAIKSKLGKEATHKMQLEMLELRKDKNNLTEDGTIKPDVIRVESIKWMAEITESWKGVEDDNGKVMKPTKDNIIKAYTEYEELANAVYNFAANSGNFVTKQPKDS